MIADKISSSLKKRPSVGHPFVGVPSRYTDRHNFTGKNVIYTRSDGFGYGLFLPVPVHCASLRPFKVSR